MKKIKVSEATGPALDWLVAKCWYSDEYDKDRVFIYHSGFDWAKHTVRVANQATCTRDLSFGWNPTTDWAQGGPIIERERISVNTNDNTLYGVPVGGWLSEVEGLGYCTDGPTPLIAAMRCLVASTLGEEAEVPEELA